MVKKLTQEKVWELIQLGDEDFYLEELRKRHDISAESSVFYTSINRFVEQRKLRRLGRGRYRRVKKVIPVRVFTPDRKRRPVFNLMYPLDKSKEEEIEIANHIINREGDLITIGGVKSKSKTLLCMNFAASNIHTGPVLMGNEYTVKVDGGYDPSPRFLGRLDRMGDWVNWVDDGGYDRFTLLPVKADYAEHIVADKINIIDWINLDANQLYDISKVLEDIKAAVGRGIAIVAIQKGEGAINPRGGQFVRDFSDVEILLDGFGHNDDDILLTVKGCKEKNAPIVGKTYAYTIVEGGTQIWNFREVKKCKTCYGKGYRERTGECADCRGVGYVDK